MRPGVRRFLILSVGFLLVLATIAFGLLPHAVHWGLEIWLDSRSRISAEIQDVDFNPFTGDLTIKTLLAQRQGTDGRLVWDRASFEVEWWPLTRKRILLEDVSLQDATVTLRREEGVWYVGGLKVQTADKEKEKETGWKFGSGSIDLENVRVIFREGEVSKDILLNGHLDPVQPWNPEKTAGVDLRIEADGWTIRFDGEAEPFAPSHAVRGMLAVRDLSIPWFAPVLPEGKPIPEGTIDTDIDILLRFPPDGPRLEMEQSGIISVNGIAYETAGFRVSDSTVAWDGSVHLVLPEEEAASPVITVQGELSSPSLNVSATDPAVRISASDLSIRQNFDMGTGEIPEDVSFFWRGGISAGEMRLRQGGADSDFLSMAGLVMEGGALAGTERMTVEKIRFRGLSGQLVRSEEGILEIPFGERKGGEKETEAERGKKEDAFPDFRIGLLEIADDSRMTYTDRTVSPVARLEIDPLRVRIESVGNLSPEEREQASRLDIQVGVNGKTVSFEGSGKPFAEERALEGRLRLQSLPLDWIKPFVGLKEFTGIKTFVSADTRLSFSLPAEGEGFSLGQEGNISADGIAGAASGYRVTDSALSWDGSMQLSFSGAEEAPAISARGLLNAPRMEVLALDRGIRLDSKNIAVRQNLEMGTTGVPEGAPFLWQGRASTGNLRLTRSGKEVDLLNMDGLVLEGIRLIGTENIEADTIRLRNPQFAELTGEAEKPEDTSYVLASEEFLLRDVLLRGTEWVEAGTIRLQGAAGTFIRNEQGKMEFPEFGAGPEERAGEGAEKEEKEGEGIEFGIGLLEIVGESRVLFTDRSVSPEVRLEMNPFEARIESLDSTHSEMKSPVHVRTRLGPYSEFSVTGTVETFTPKRTMHLESELDSFSLPQVTGYAERFIGHRVRSGDLNFTIDMAVEQGVLDAQVRLTLIKLQLEPLERSEIQEKVVNQLGFPLNRGLSLLRGEDDRIELDFPVSGSLRSPEVGIAGILRRPLLRAVRNSVLSYFSPIGAMAMLGKRLIFDRAVALRFEPAYFLPGEDDLIPAVKEYLNDVADKMKDRSEAAIILCGAATEGDIAALREEDPSAEELLDLARRRSERVKEYLISQGIEQERLVLCTPEMDDDPQGRPRVEIGV